MTCAETAARWCALNASASLIAAHRYSGSQRPGPARIHVLGNVLSILDQNVVGSAGCTCSVHRKLDQALCPGGLITRDISGRLLILNYPVPTQIPRCRHRETATDRLYSHSTQLTDCFFFFFFFLQPNGRCVEDQTLIVGCINARSSLRTGKAENLLETLFWQACNVERGISVVPCTCERQDSGRKGGQRATCYAACKLAHLDPAAFGTIPANAAGAQRVSVVRDTSVYPQISSFQIASLSLPKTQAGLSSDGRRSGVTSAG